MEKKPEKKSCARCGVNFECLHNEKCWCLTYEISIENLKKLQETYKNCLCPSCLSLYGSKKPDEESC
jgi:ribosomal protein L34E